jgi:hypothetical protein
MNLHDAITQKLVTEKDRVCHKDDFKSALKSYMTRNIENMCLFLAYKENKMKKSKNDYDPVPVPQAPAMMDDFSLRATLRKDIQKLRATLLMARNRLDMIQGENDAVNEIDDVLEDTE